MSGNYIKVCRSLLDWEWYTNENTMRLFIHCLLKANWKEGHFEGQTIKRGSFVTSLPTLAMELSLTESQVRTALKHLESTGELTVKSTNKFRIITVNNWSRYQDNRRQIADKSQTDSRQIADKSQTNDSNRRKKEEEEEETGKQGKSNKRFKPPTTNEVREYCVNGGYNIDPDAFVDFYEAKGWMVGKNKMKDWQAAVRGWARRENDKPRKKDTSWEDA